MLKIEAEAKLKFSAKTKFEQTNKELWFVGYIFYKKIEEL